MTYFHVPIHRLPQEDRPREKMERLGPESLSTSELLAILLGSGTRSSSAVDLGKSLMMQFDGLLNLARAGIPELKSVNGIGQAKASVLTAAFELGRRKLQSKSHKPRLNTAKSIAEYLRPKLVDHNCERFLVLYMNSNCQVLTEKLVSVGGLDSVFVDPKVILREALYSNATNIVLSHNHPSGNTKPSYHDNSLTARMIQAADIMGCNVLDHVIVSHRGYYSYNDSGKLDQLRAQQFYQIAME